MRDYDAACDDNGKKKDSDMTDQDTIRILTQRCCELEQQLKVYEIRQRLDARQQTTNPPLYPGLAASLVARIHELEDCLEMSRETCHGWERRYIEEYRPRVRRLLRILRDVAKPRFWKSHEQALEEIKSILSEPWVKELLDD